MRNMSFAWTTPQARAKEKTVTRRQAWWKLKPGTLIQQVEKGMGLKKGEKMVKIHVVRIVAVELQVIFEVTQEDCVKEGFPELTPQAFVQFYCKGHGLDPTDVCNRIEFEYVD